MFSRKVQQASIKVGLIIIMKMKEKFMIRAPLLLLLAAAPAAACSAKPPRQVPGSDVSTAAHREGVANLPFADGRVFHSLDEYLAFRRQAGAYDVPWYRKVGPNEYEVVGQRRPGAAKPKRVTRDELMRRFGFTR